MFRTPAFIINIYGTRTGPGDPDGRRPVAACIINYRPRRDGRERFVVVRVRARHAAAAGSTGTPRRQNPRGTYLCPTRRRRRRRRGAGDVLDVRDRSINFEKRAARLAAAYTCTSPYGIIVIRGPYCVVRRTQKKKNPRKLSSKLKEKKKKNVYITIIV